MPLAMTPSSFGQIPQVAGCNTPVEDFEGMSIAPFPQGSWSTLSTTGNATHDIVASSPAFGSDQVLKSSSINTTLIVDRFSYTPVSWNNGTAEVKFSCSTVSVSSNFQIILFARIVDASNFIGLHWRSNLSQPVLFETIAGSQVLRGAPPPIGATVDTPYLMRMTLTGTSADVFLLDANDCTTVLSSVTGVGLVSNNTGTSGLGLVSATGPHDAHFNDFYTASA